MKRPVSSISVPLAGHPTMKIERAEDGMSLTILYPDVVSLLSVTELSEMVELGLLHFPNFFPVIGPFPTGPVPFKFGILIPYFRLK